MTRAEVRHLPVALVLTSSALDRQGADASMRRLALLLEGISGDFDVTVRVLSQSSEGSEEIDDWPVAHPGSRAVAIERNPRMERSLVGLARRALWLLGGRYPSSCHPRRVPSSLSEEMAMASVVITHLPSLAHLALTREAADRALCLLDEGFERQRQMLTPNVSRLRSALSRLRHRAEVSRSRRLYRRLRDRGVPVIAISDAEARWFTSRAPGLHVVVVKHAVADLQDRPSNEPTYDVGIFGNLRESRNVAPAKAVMEVARKRGVAWSWLLAGASDPGSFPASCDSNGSQVTLTGPVRDLLPHFRRVRVALVPSLHVTGVKTTILESWSVGVPVVCSEAATHGLAIADGENALVGRGVSDLVEACERLLADAELRRRLVEGGRRTLVRDHDPAESQAAFLEACLGVARVT